MKRNNNRYKIQTATELKCPFCNSTSIKKVKAERSSSHWYCIECHRIWDLNFLLKKTLKTKYVAMLFDVSPTTITNWAEKGILKKVNIKEVKVPLYDEIEVQKLLLKYRTGDWQIPLAEERKSLGESKTHFFLKSIAKDFLLSIGCKNIVYEAQAGNGEVRVRVDVLGVDENRRAVVECGGSTNSKLLKLSKFVDEIYILPYGQKKPYLWTNSTEICSSCGHKK